MSYYSRVYHQRNAHTHDEAAKQPFFAKKNDSNSGGQKNAFLQAKLSVNEPGDNYEREADSFANAVVFQPAKVPFIQQKEAMPEMDKKRGIQKKDNPITEEEKKKKITPVQAKPEGGEATASPHVSSKIENSSGKGNPLPQKTLHEMSSSFGVDFSHVNIHNDSEAINLNSELQAQAFTHGRDIYFNEGKYNPENKEGKLLLAHELTHVVQQQNTLQKKQIQRSFWGTVGGVLAGAAGGFLAGGPVGAIVGGVVGGVAGDAATTDIRGLNKAERQEAQKVFGNSLNYDAVRVSDSSKLMQIGGYARTPFNTIFFPTGTLGRSDPAYYAWLIHELTHAWQTQHGVSTFTKIKYAVRKSSYDFGGDAGLEQAIKEGKCFTDFNTEAQGDILEKYYQILTGQDTGDGLLYYHFVSQVQYFSGRCEPAGIKDDSLDPKYRSGESPGNTFA